MTTKIAGVRRRPTGDQFVQDIGNVLRRHRVRCGSRECVDALVAGLETNPALRGDLFNLLTAISHMGEEDLSPDELLGLVAQAAGGPELRGNDPGPALSDAAREGFLRQYQSWNNRELDLAMLPAERMEEISEHGNVVESGGTGGMLAAAADRVAESSAGERRTRPEIGPETRIGDLTITELRSFLDELERRVGELSARIEADADANSGEAVLEIRAAALRDALMARVAEQAEREAARVEELRAAAQAAQESEVEETPVVVLPLRLAPDTSDEGLFRASAGPARSGSRVLRAVAASIVVLGAAAGLGYRYMHKTGDVPSGQPVVIQPAVVPPAATAPETGSPETAAPTERTPQAVGARDRTGTVPGQPRVLPRAMRMEAQAAHSEAADEGSAATVPTVRRPAPVVRSTPDSTETATPPQ